MTAAGTGAGLLADASDVHKAGPAGLLVILLLGVATVLLVRSMGRHLNRVPPSFDPDDGRPDDGSEDGTGDDRTDENRTGDGAGDDRGPGSGR